MTLISCMMTELSLSLIRTLERICTVVEEPLALVFLHEYIQVHSDMSIEGLGVRMQYILFRGGWGSPVNCTEVTITRK